MISLTETCSKVFFPLLYITNKGLNVFEWSAKIPTDWK